MIDKDAWRYYARFYRGKWGKVFFVFVLSILQSVLVFPVVFLAKRVVDKIIPAADTQSLVAVGGFMMGFIVISGLLSYLNRRIALLTNSSIVEDLRFDLVDRFYSLPVSSVNKIDRGKLHTIFLADVGRIDTMGNMLIATLLPAGFASLILSGAVVYLSWKLFVVLLVLLPVFLIVTQKMGLRIKETVDAHRKSFQELSKRMFFVIWMSELTKLQTAEDFEAARQKEGLMEYRALSVAMALQQSLYGIVQKCFTGFIGVIVMVVGGFAITSGAMSLGELVSFFIAARLLQGYASRVFSAIPTVISGNEALIDISRLVGLKDKSPYSGTKEIEFFGAVSLRNITFGYDGDLVLRDASMELSRGSTVTVLGPNGAGKSTITNLILGFYRPGEGGVFAEGVSYEDLSMLNLRKRIGIVPQNPTFFKGTIYENIVYGVPHVTQKDVEDAAKQAGAHQFIVNLPNGYETSLADAGALVSGGERQLIAICRALLRSPRLLILDEPTNHLSKEAVQTLLENLRGGKSRRTTLIISHQWEIAKDADRIYYLENGKLKPIDSEAMLLFEDRLAEKQGIHQITDS